MNILLYLKERTCTGQAAPSPKAHIECPSICFDTSNNMSISSTLALPVTIKTKNIFNVINFLYEYIQMHRTNLATMIFKGKIINFVRWHFLAILIGNERAHVMKLAITVIKRTSLL